MLTNTLFSLSNRTESSEDTFKQVSVFITRKLLNRLGAKTTAAICNIDFILFLQSRQQGLGNAMHKDLSTAPVFVKAHYYVIKSENVC